MNLINMFKSINQPPLPPLPPLTPLTPLPPPLPPLPPLPLPLTLPIYALNVSSLIYSPVFSSFNILVFEVSAFFYLADFFW